MQEAAEDVSVWTVMNATRRRCGVSCDSGAGYKCHDLLTYLPAMMSKPGIILMAAICLCVCVSATGAALPDNNDASRILPLQMAECLLRAQPDSVANHITARQYVRN